MAEYKAEGQNNLGWSQTFSASKAVPLIAKRVYDTYANALDFIQNDPTALAGLVITIFKDTESTKNGVYFVQSTGIDGKIVKLGEAGDISNIKIQDIDRKSIVFVTTQGQETKTIKVKYYVPTEQLALFEKDVAYTSGDKTHKLSEKADTATVTSIKNDLEGKITNLTSKVDTDIQNLADNYYDKTSINEKTTAFDTRVTAAEKKFDNYYDKDTIDTKLTSVYTYKGTLDKSKLKLVPDTTDVYLLPTTTTDLLTALNITTEPAPTAAAGWVVNSPVKIQTKDNVIHSIGTNFALLGPVDQNALSWDALAGDMADIYSSITWTNL